MWIGKDDTIRYHDQFEVLCELEQMIEDDFMTLFEVICGLEQMI
jgi:hypothetical protein